MTPKSEAANDNSAAKANRRVAGVIITHGHLANELLAAAEMIVGALRHVSAVSIGWHDDVDAARHEIERAVERVSEGRGVLLLTDMFGGTPTNIAAMFLEENAVEVVTGVNLPMVIKLASQNDGESLEEVAKRVCDQGREGIYLAGELLAAPKSKRSSSAFGWKSMREQHVKIVNRLGLHARAAARLVRTASRYESTLRLKRADRPNVEADAKSILSVLTLAATCGTELRATAEGSDEQAAVGAVCELIASGLGEGEQGEQ